MDKKINTTSCPMPQVGGQALIEGVMMKNGNRVSIAVRKDDGTIDIQNTEFHPVKEKHKLLGKPIIRGIVGFFESLVLSFKTMGKATDMLGLEDEDTKKKEEEKKGGGSTVFVMVISLILGLALALFLFTILPTLLAQFLTDIIGMDESKWYYFITLASIEGVSKVLIFIGYLLAVSQMKDIKRTFQYHGAEHKSIACLEKGLELTPENARDCTRFHPRCGTSFMFVMVLISILIGIFIPLEGWLRVAIRIAILPIVMGLGYEFIMLAGKHRNKFTRALSAPGLWMQRITTKEPDDYQLAIAICALKASLPEMFPDFKPDEYFISKEENKGHIAYEEEKKEEEETAEDAKETKKPCFPYTPKVEINTTIKVKASTKRCKKTHTVPLNFKKYK